MIWKDIKGFEGVYQVSDSGLVKSLPKTVSMGYEHRGRRHYPESILKPGHDPKGYPFVNLCNNTKPKCYKIHRLVATAFIDNPFNKPQINHINGDKKDNRVENLEWCTGSENQQHAYNTGLNTRHKICSVSIPVIVEKLNGEYVGEFGSIQDAATYLKSSRTHASRVLAGLKKSCKGHSIRRKLDSHSAPSGE